MLERTIFSLRRTGVPGDQERADRIALELQQRGQDIPLDEAGKEISIARISDEQRRILAERKLILHGKPLTGQSIRSLREAGRPFWSNWHQKDEFRTLETLPSRRSEVATLPGLFLPDSNRKPLEAQLEMVAHLSEELEEYDLRAVIGDAPDYVELAFNRLDETGERLFGPDYNYHYARTVTPVGSGVARVGDFGADSGLRVYRWHPGRGGGALWAAPLVVPVENGQ